MLTEVSNKIEILLTLEQRRELYLATGMDHTRAIEVRTKNLAALVLASLAVGSDALPISESAETIKKMLDHSGSVDKSPFILKVELTTEQREQIRQVTGKTISSIMLAPDEMKVIFEENWQEGPPLLRIGRSLVIVSDSKTYEATPYDKVITLPRGAGTAQSVFGTGLHPATQLALTFMEERLKGGEQVLDLGTGSGVLAVAAVRLGAAQVTALDIADAAVAMARDTVVINGVSDVVKVSLGSIESAEGKYDMVLANIFTGVIISLAEKLANVVRPSGLLLGSGIIAARAADVVRAMHDVGFELEQERNQGGWRALLFRRV